ncbi:phosphodiester glycosidase family protein [Brevibacillus fulvus]|uniref:Exopolysaccharide biosynthesis protein n=1 Tax=Brevibacillus fulvus TaxID=1125967 RepID=A0A938XZ69_9BACL|nr:phosphodiester glycosidase family protein [Brevibacillus fulvus]MBM7590486.1 exopolysaccharide biosynthesis protein [Brevibacillus fulvus]
METTLSRTRTMKKRRRRNSPLTLLKHMLLATMLFFLLLMLAAAIFLFGTQKGMELREWIAGTLLTTQHDYLAPFTFLPKAKLDELKNELNHPVIINTTPAEAVDKPVEPMPAAEEKPRELVEIEDVNIDKGSYYFKGKLMYISDPQRVHLVVTERTDDRGDLLDEFAKKYNAIGIVNASGFYDPDGYGRGKSAFGVVIHDGKILQSYNPRSNQTALGITYDGKMITGNYSAEELVAMGVRDAMSFSPQLIVNGKNLFADKAGTAWGNQPRTAVGQKADGTVVFLVIDGRQPGHSIGASMKDVADLLEQKGVVTAMAMDGGSSSMMLHNGEAITKTSCPYYRGRYLPNAWAVY